MIRALLMALALVLAFAAPAEAHKLKVFAAVEGDHIGGYGFFIGGGRAQGTEWSAKTADGTVLAEGRTDDNGTFGFDLATPAGIRYHHHSQYRGRPHSTDGAGRLALHRGRRRCRRYGTIWDPWRR